jgi:hypothetical protein
MKSKPYLINTDRRGHALEPIASEAKHFSESWLQELLDRHPHILPVDEIEPVFWPLVPIGREIATDVGYIDNLFISEAGYPAIGEAYEQELCKVLTDKKGNEAIYSMIETTDIEQLRTVIGRFIEKVHKARM